MRKQKHLGRMMVSVLLMTIIVSVMAPFTAFAQESEHKVVRVGWYESPFEMTDGNGRRSGYAYEYQQRIANYTGWTYEYVEGSWPELMEMLVNGEIDLLNDVSYTDERAARMMFSSLPMGTEEYYLYAAPGDQKYSKDDLSTFNGARVA